MLVPELCTRTLRMKRLSKSTQYGWHHACKLLQYVEVDQIDRDFALDHKEELLESEYAESYIRTQLGYLGSMWTRAMDRRYVDFNPWQGLLKGLKRGKKRYPLLPFEHFKEFHNDPLFMAIWLHGFRVNEAACLLPEDFVTNTPIPYINIEHNHIRKCKNDYTQRRVPIHPSFTRFIDKWTFSNNPGAGDNFSRRLKKKTGISAHGIRHSQITRMRSARVEYSIAMSIVGHKPQGMTADYGEVLLEDMAKELQRIQ